MKHYCPPLRSAPTMWAFQHNFRPKKGQGIQHQKRGFDKFLGVFTSANKRAVRYARKRRQSQISDFLKGDPKMQTNAHRHEQMRTNTSGREITEFFCAPPFSDVSKPMVCQTYGLQAGRLSRKRRKSQKRRKRRRRLRQLQTRS